MAQRYGPNDTPPLTGDADPSSGDMYFIGVDERTEVGLRPGYVKAAQNKRFRRGRAETRLGYQMLRCLKTDGQTPWSEIYTVGVFSDPQSFQEWILVAADGGLWRTGFGRIAEQMTLPDGVTLTRDTAKQILQCFGQALLLRGQEGDPLASIGSMEAGLRNVPAATSPAYNSMPRATRGAYVNNRLVLASVNDECAVSDPLTLRDFPPTQTELKVNTGNNDKITALAAFGRTNILALKDQSIIGVENFYGDLTSLAACTVTDKHGCIAPRSVVQYGQKNLAWLSDGEIWTLALTDQGEMQGVSEPLSAPMRETMKRVNWAYASGACSGYYDGKLYFALPLDDARLLGPNLATGLTYNVGGLPYQYDALTEGYLDYCVLTGLVVGQKYVYTAGSANDQYLESAGNRGSFDFIATATTALLYGVHGQTCGATVKQVVAEGVNNYILVYDTINQAWCGVDTFTGMCVQEFFTFTYDGQKRLGFASRDGYLYLVEEGFTDEVRQAVSTPYVDFVVGTNGAYPGIVTVQVNGGTVVTGALSSTNTGANGWGVYNSLSAFSVPSARDHLWSNNTRGYDQTLANKWTAPNTTPSQIYGGIRFTATNGVVPVVKIDGTTQTASGFYSWAGLDFHSGYEIQPLAIADSLTTRAYLCGSSELKRFNELHVLMATWNPSYSISVALDGAGRSTSLVSGRTRSRTTFDAPFDAAAYDETNADANAGTAHRQDYSSVLPALGLDLNGSTGVFLDQHQETPERTSLTEQGYWAQVTISNTQGRCEIRAINLVAQPDRSPLAVMV